MVREVTQAGLVSYVKNIKDNLFKRKYRNECEADILYMYFHFHVYKKLFGLKWP